MYTCRYGLPVNFQAMLLLPHKKSLRKLREVLNDLYSHLDNSAMSGDMVSDIFILIPAFVYFDWIREIICFHKFYINLSFWNFIC